MNDWLPYVLGAAFVLRVLVWPGDNLASRCGTCGQHVHAWSRWTWTGDRCADCHQPIRS